MQNAECRMQSELTTESMRINILNVMFDNVTRAEALERLRLFLEHDSCHILYTPNPEMVMSANSDAGFLDVLNKADLIVPDGIGIVLASWINGYRLKERVAGCDLIFDMFDAIKDTGKTVYLLGGKPGVAELAAQNMRVKYQGLSIIGCHDGYFSKDDESQLLDEIITLKPDILLVGLGMERQEKWIHDNRDLPVRLAAGVGGSLDIMSGTVKRAPKFFRQIGLEWFYRLISQPSRAQRMLKLPIFVIKVFYRRMICLIK